MKTTVQKKTVSILILSVLFLISRNRSAYAFNIVPPPSSEPSKLDFIDYQIPDRSIKVSGYTETKEYKPLSPPKDSKTDPKSIIAQLEDAANPWSGNIVFKSASQPLSSLAKFDISEYHPCVPTIPCSLDQYSPATGVVGAAFRMNYIPFGSIDPSPLDFGASIQWIQRITATSITQSKYGKTQIDIATSNFPPFYTTNGSYPDPQDPWEYVFKDRPRRMGSDILSIAASQSKVYDWTAELYLATSSLNQTTGKYEVTLYDGIQWGWKTTLLDPKKPTPPPGSPSNAPNPPQAESVCNYVVHAIYSGVVYDGCDLVATNALEAKTDMASDADINLHLTGDTQSSTQNTAGVPEPSSITGAILAVGLWGGVTWQKKRRNKQIKP